MVPDEPGDAGAAALAATVAPARTPSEFEATDTVAAPLSSAGPEAASSATVLPRVDDASYKLDREIARGGMGKIVAAEDRRLGRPVALKVLLEPAGDALGRFQREALITARLQHPGIVPVYEARAPTGSCGSRIINEGSPDDLAREGHDPG